MPTKQQQVTSSAWRETGNHLDRRGVRWEIASFVSDHSVSSKMSSCTGWFEMTQSPLQGSIAGLD
jgi:hypothetical protein